VKLKTLIIILFSIIATLSLGTPTQAYDKPHTFHQSDSCQTATIHYRRRNADYDGWGLHVCGPTPMEGVVTWTSHLVATGEDDFGLSWIMEMNPGAGHVNYVIHRGGEKDPGPDQSLYFKGLGCEIWQVQGKPDQFFEPEIALEALVINIEAAQTPNLDQVILHYRRMGIAYLGSYHC